MGEVWKEFSSYFIENKALFGSFPTHERAKLLIDMGVKYFVNLTEEGEVPDPYHRSEDFTGFWVNFGIPDRSVPRDLIGFSSLIKLLLLTIDGLGENERIYIHCRGGHGRAGIVVAALLSVFHRVKTTRALELTDQYHNNRTVMREKWRKMGSPQNRSQKMYVHKFLSDMVFFRAYKTGPSNGFSTYSEHLVTVPEDSFCTEGTYPTSEALFQACKAPGDQNYTEKQKGSRNPSASRKMGSKIEPPEDWDAVEAMRKVLRLKFDQHDGIRRNLLMTGRRRIIFNSRKDLLFGIGGNGTGQNHLGKILMSLRDHYLSSQMTWKEFKQL